MTPTDHDPVETLCEAIRGTDHYEHDRMLEWMPGRRRCEWADESKNACREHCPSCALLREFRERERREDEAALRGLAFHTLHFSTPCNWDCTHLSIAKAFLDRARGEEKNHG